MPLSFDKWLLNQTISLALLLLSLTLYFTGVSGDEHACVIAYVP